MDGRRAPTRPAGRRRNKLKAVRKVVRHKTSTAVVITRQKISSLVEINVFFNLKENIKYYQTVSNQSSEIYNSNK